MGGLVKLFDSSRGWVVLVLMIAVVVLVAMHAITGPEALDALKLVAFGYIGGRSVEESAKALATRPARAPSTVVVNNTMPPPPEVQ